MTALNGPQGIIGALFTGRLWTVSAYTTRSLHWPILTHFVVDLLTVSPLFLQHGRSACLREGFCSMELIQSLNLGVRFLLELGALVAFGYWGNQSGQGPLRFALAIGLSIMAAIVWDGQLGPLDRAPLRLAVVHWIRKC